MSAPRNRRRLRPALAVAAASLLALVLATGCQSTTRPTAPPQVVIDVVGTVTAQAAPAIATQTAVSAAFTQVAQAEVTQTAQAQAQQTATGQVAAANAIIATQTALAQVASAQAATATSLAQVAAAQAGTATALAQAVAVPAGTATVAALPASTATMLPTTTVTVSVSASGTPTAPAPVACVALNPAFTALAGKATAAGLALGCPTATAYSVNGAVQEFWKNLSNPDPKTHWRSLMIWREDTKSLYVIDGQDTQTGQGKLLSYADTFKEGEPDIPPACATLQPPAGYQMPVRGFAKAWCANNLAGVIGWPKGKETNASLLVQPALNGLLIKVSAPDQNLGALVALDYSAGRAVTSPVAP